MLYIRKGIASAKVSSEIDRVKRDVEWNKADHIDSDVARMAFDQLDKNILRTQLIEEQKGLCAYCMRRIEQNENTTIEHVISIREDPEKALQYENWMACCDGGRKSTMKPHVLCCDAAKEDQRITITPYNKEQMKRIRYRADGTIYVYPDDPKLTRDINQVLRLNGEQDEHGCVINDTSTRLIYGRRQVYKYYELFIQRIDKKGKPIKPIIKKRLKELTEKKNYDEFTGVWIYFLERKIRQAG